MDELLGFQSGALRGPQVSVPAAPKMHGGRFGGEREPLFWEGEARLWRRSGEGSGREEFLRLRWEGAVDLDITHNLL